MSKILRKVFSLCLTVVLLCGAIVFEGFPLPVTAAPVITPTPIYLDTGYSFAERAADLVARMTRSQKANQMVANRAAEIPAGSDAAGEIGTGMRAYHWWGEALHGYNTYGNSDGGGGTNVQNATSYPIPQSLGQTWDQELIYRVTNEISDEIRERTAGLDANLNFYSPVVELTRDPRHGRNTEEWSEDPVLSAKLASQFINGFQGLMMDGETPVDPNGYYKANATLKHYFSNNSENNRFNGVSNLTEQEVREYYSAVYRNIVKWSKPASVMASYNRIQIANPMFTPFTVGGGINEIPGGINFYTMDILLRQTFGFTGYVSGDYDAMIVAGFTGNGVVNTSPTQGMTGGSYTNLGHSWRPPQYTWYHGDTINGTGATIAGQILSGWAVMGGQNQEGNYNSLFGGKHLPTEANLPGGSSTGADYANTPFGKYTDEALDAALLPILEGRLRTGEFDDKVTYSSAPSAESSGRVTWFDQARERLVSYGVTIPTTVNERASTGTLTMTANRLDLVAEAASKSLVLLKNDGNLLPMKIPAAGNFSVGVYGTMSAGNANVILGSYSANNSSSGKQINLFNGISAAIKEKNPNASVISAGTTYTESSSGAENYDYVIALVGDVGGSSYAAEQRDRVDFALSNNSGNTSGTYDQTTIQNLYAANKNLIVVMITSGTIGEATPTSNMFANIPALLASSFLGDMPGPGVGKVLVGDENPSARTNDTWYPVSSAARDNSDTNGASINQINSYRLSPGIDGPWQSPLYTETGATMYPLAGPYTFTGYNRGRTYMYYNGEGAYAPRFPFGFGLSYTTFDYSNMQMFVNGEPQSGFGAVAVNPNDKIEVTVDVTNTGMKDGADVVEFYVKTPADIKALSDTGPKGQAFADKRLKDFAKTKVLSSGETQTVKLSVDVPELAFYNMANKKFELYQSSNDYVLQISRSAADNLVVNGQNCGVVQSRNMRITNAGSWNPKVSVVSFKPNTPADVIANIPQRLIYSSGDTVNPNPTVCMANDVLYGTINRLFSASPTDQQYPIPSNITMSYSSNRPNVVSTTGGLITARAGGVATITGTAYDSITGSSASSEFVVYVQGEEAEPLDHDATIKSYSFGGETFTTADRVYDYDIALPTTKTSITAADFSLANITLNYPEKVDATITLSPANGAVSVGAPCVATITVTSKEFPEDMTRKYNIYFGHFTVNNLENINFMGFNSSADVRFSDGVTSFMLIQAFYKDGRLVTLNSSQIEAFDRHKAGRLQIGTGSVIDMSDLTMKFFVWDGKYAPLAPTCSDYTNLD